MCRKKQTSQVTHSRSKVHNIHFNNDSDESTESDQLQSSYFVDSIIHDKSRSQAFAELAIGPKSQLVKMKIDSGAQVNILPKSTFTSLGLKLPLKSTHKTLSAYDGKPLKVSGSITLACTFKNIKVHHEFFIVDTLSNAIVGLDTSLALNLIKLVYAVGSEPDVPMDKNTVLSKYRELFDGVGLFPGECEIHLKENATPVVHPPRRVPIALCKKLKTELDNMETDGIIAKVTHPTDWVNSLVIVEKANGRLRLCLDPKNLNDCIKRPHYPMKSLDDILPDLSKATVFSKLNARSGY